MANETITGKTTKPKWYGANPIINNNSEPHSRYVEIIPPEKLWPDTTNPQTTLAEMNRRDKDNPPTTITKVTKWCSCEETNNNDNGENKKWVTSNHISIVIVRLLEFTAPATPDDTTSRAGSYIQYDYKKSSK